MSMTGSMRVLGSSLLVVPGSMQLGEESMNRDFLDWFSEIHRGIWSTHGIGMAKLDFCRPCRIY